MVSRRTGTFSYYRVDFNLVGGMLVLSYALSGPLGKVLLQMLADDPVLMAVGAPGGAPVTRVQARVMAFIHPYVLMNCSSSGQLGGKSLQQHGSFDHLRFLFYDQDIWFCLCLVAYSATC